MKENEVIWESKGKNAQKHFDFYVQVLMEETDKEELYFDFLQIALAVRRMLPEDVGSEKYSFGNVHTKYLALAGGFVEKQLRKLIDGTATSEDARDIELAIKSVELGEVQYPVNINYLRKKLQQLESI